MTEEQMADAFNEWMRRYTEDPATFEVEFRTVGTYLTDKAQGKEPSYGQVCAAYLREIVHSSARVPTPPLTP